jgi:hypothetical protein
MSGTKLTLSPQIVAAICGIAGIVVTYFFVRNEYVTSPPVACKRASVQACKRASVQAGKTDVHCFTVSGEIWPRRTLASRLTSSRTGGQDKSERRRALMCSLRRRRLRLEARKCRFESIFDVFRRQRPAPPRRECRVS